MAKGTMGRLIRGRGFGFIRRDGGYELFFQRRELRGVSYDSLREGQRVEFEVTWTSGGGREVKVRLIGKKS